MQVANFYPNRITITSKRERTHTQVIDSWLNKYHADPTYKKEGIFQKNLQKAKSTLNLSKNSVRTLRNSVNSLIFLSKPRTVYSPSKNPIYNFRGAFITLTIPAAQNTTDTDMKKCLDLFLQDLRRVYKVKNYVWRSELQKNGNVHFHIVIDQYIYHKVVRNYWLKALRHTSYVQDYQKKFLPMSFVNYRNYRLSSMESSLQNSDKVLKSIVKAYAYGVRTMWLSPNCTDIKNIYNVNQMSAYVAKYLAKECKKLADGETFCPDYQPTEERIAAFGKVWGRSTSLSGLKYIFPYVLESVQTFIDALIDSGSVFTKTYEWATIHYFNFKSMPQQLYQRIHRNIYNVAKTWSYPLPVI